MKKHLILGLALALCAEQAAGAAEQPAAGIHVSMGDVTDNRSTGQFFKELKVEFKLTGDAVFDAYGIGEPVFAMAKDDTGRSLLKEEKPQALLWTFQGRQRKSENETVHASLINPARRAATASFEGTIPVYIPSRDPAAVVAVPSLAAAYGKQVEWKSIGVSVTVLDKEGAAAWEKAREEATQKASGTLGNALNHAFEGSGLNDNSLQFVVTDPQSRLVRIELISGGQVLEPNSRMQRSSDKPDVYVYSYRQKIPADASLKIYLTSAQSLISVPFKFEGVPLP